jgi:hypothetical protein
MTIPSNDKQCSFSPPNTKTAMCSMYKPKIIIQESPLALLLGTSHRVNYPLQTLQNSFSFRNTSSADFTSIEPSQFGAGRVHQSLICLTSQLPRPRHTVLELFITLLPGRLGLSSSDKREHIPMMIRLLRLYRRIERQSDWIQSTVNWILNSNTANQELGVL